MNEPYETLDNAIELEQLDRREQAYEAEVHNLVSELRQLIEHQPPETGVHHFFSAIATLQLVANNGGIASLTDEEARAITNELEQLDHREQAYEAEVHNLVSQLRQAAQWLQNLRNAGYTDILIEHQPPETGVHHFFSAIAHAERTPIEEVVLSFDMRHTDQGHTYERAYRALSRDYDVLVSEVDLELDEQKDLIARLLENLRQTVDALSYWFPRWGDPKGANSQMMINARCAIAEAEAHLRYRAKEVT